MENLENKIDLTSFKRANNQMIATNDSAYKNWWGSRNYSERIREYSLKEIEQIINSTSLQEQQNLSRSYFYKNGIYKRLIIYYATLLKYTGILIPNPSFGKSLSTPHIQKRYFNAVDFIDNLNLPVIFTNCAQRALVDGCYYGVLQKVDKDGISILDLPTGWCRSRFKDSNGNDVVEFDVSYFKTISNEKDRNSALKVYPKEISNAYNAWIKNKGPQWVFVSTDIGMCFPFFDGRPLFLSIIPEVIRYEDTVEIEIERDIEEIRKILIQKIPHLNDGRLVFEPDEAEDMHRGAVGMLKGNKNISVLTTYADVDAIVSKTAADNTHNNIGKMMQNIYNKAGASAELFASTGSSTLSTSVQNDVALMMVLANKFSLFLTNLINRLFKNSNIDFKYTILPISYYNEEKYIDSAFKVASSGYSFLLPSLALGFSQKDLSNIKDLENDVLKLGEKLIPLASSYTQTGNGENGAPKKAEEEKAEKTLENEKSLDNQTGGGSN